MTEVARRWGVGRIKWDTSMRAGATPSTDDEELWLDGDDPRGMPFVAIADMSRRERVASTAKSLSPEGLSSRGIPVGNSGTLLFAMYASVGEVAFLDCVATWNQALLGITPDPRKVDSRFLRYVLLDMRDDLLREVRSNTQSNLNAGQVGDIWFQRPEVEEQRAIADYLDRETARIDTLIAEQQRLIERLRERRGAVIAAGLDATKQRMTRLKHVSTVQTGVTLSGDGEPSDPEWPYLRVANVQIGHVDLREVKTIRLPSERAATSTLQVGDVLMTEGGDIDKLGRGALWEGDQPNMLHQNHIFAVRPTEMLDSEYLVHWLDGPVARKYFRITAKQTTNLAGTNKWTLGNLPVPLLSVDEQRRIVALLDEQTSKIHQLIAETERFIELSRERRAALITAAVTGQIDVREVA